MLLGQSFIWSLMAGACTVGGAMLLLIRKRWNIKSLAFFLGLAAGVMVAVVFFDLLPSVLLFPGQIKGIAGLLVGMLIIAWFDYKFWRNIDSTKNLANLGYLIMLGIALHDLPEGMAIAFGAEMKTRIGMVIALGVGIHNIPEGMAIAAPLIVGGVNRAKILFQMILVGLITPLGTLLGRWLLIILPKLLPFMLGLAAGVMIYLVIFQLWPQAKKQDPIGLWAGFCLGIIIIFWASFL